MSDARGQPQTRTVSAPGNAKQAAESEDEAAVATATMRTPRAVLRTASTTSCAFSRLEGRNIATTSNAASE